MKKLYFFSCSVLLVLQGCGGGGGSANGNNPSNLTTPLSLVVSGTAATGAAMPNAAITFKCQTKTYSTTSNNLGAYSTSIASNELPCLVRASDNTNKFHSIAATSNSDITVNITPHTELVTSHLLAKDPATTFDTNETLNTTNASQSKILDSISTVRQSISSLVNTDSYNPIEQKFKIGDAYDQKLDQLQASLTKKSISFHTLRNAFIEPLPLNNDRITYLNNILNPSSPSDPSSPNQVAATTQEYLTDSAQWISGTDSSGSKTFGFYIHKINNSIFNTKEYKLDALNNYYNPTYDYSVSSVNRVLTINGNWIQSYYKGPILSEAKIEQNSATGEFLLTLNSDNNELSIGKWKLSAQNSDVSGNKISSAFNSVYTKNQDGVFTQGSKLYNVWLYSISPEYLVGSNKIAESAKTASGFIEKYSGTVFCNINTNRYSNGTYYGGTKFGIQFIANTSKAQLIPVSSDCIPIADGYPLLELSWEITSVNNQEVIEISGKKLPMYETSLGQLSGGYDANEANPALRYWTDKYKFIIVRNSDGTIYTGIKTMPGASISVNPGNGPYLNNAALNSMLKVVGYPSFPK